MDETMEYNDEELKSLGESLPEDPQMETQVIFE